MVRVRRLWAFGLLGLRKRPAKTRGLRRLIGRAVRLGSLRSEWLRLKRRMMRVVLVGL